VIGQGLPPGAGLSAARSILPRRGASNNGTKRAYDHSMGLFRGRAKKNRDKATAEFLKEHTGTVNAGPESARRELKREARPNPDEPGWGQTMGLDITRLSRDRASQETVTAQPEVARREVKREARPNPDQPGWGRTMGLDITRLRRDRAGQE
jgi:hypothetical protein